MASIIPQNAIEVGMEYSNNDGWNMLNDIGVSQLFRKPCPGSELYAYKFVFTLENTEPSEFLDFCTDMDFLLKWNKHIKNLRKLDGGKYFYWETEMPFLMSNRDYVFSFKRETIEYKQHNLHLLEIHAHNGYVPEIEGITRVTDFQEVICAAVDDKCTTSSRIFCIVYNDLKMDIPKWMINFFSKVAFPKQHEELLKNFGDFQTEKRKK